MIMSSTQRVSGEAFALERLRADPDLDYAALRAEAVEAGVSLQPIHYGRARKQLGLPTLRDARPKSRGPADVASDPATSAGDARPAAGRTPRKGSAAFEFLVQELRREPGLAYAELRERANAKGFTIAPIMYGRAKAVLGLVPVKPRSKKGAARSTGAPRALEQVDSVAERRVAKSAGAVDGLDQLVQVVKDLDAERRRLRAVLERVVALIGEALRQD